MQPYVQNPVEVTAMRHDGNAGAILAITGTWGAPSEFYAPAVYIKHPQKENALLGEGDYLVRDANGLFHVYSEEDFEVNFRPKPKARKPKPPAKDTKIDDPS